MKIIFYGAARTVTGSCFMLKTNTGETLLVDCGLFQGSKTIAERNYHPFPFDPSEVDWVLLTHAHIDHSGLIPKLYKHGYKGNVITTQVTKELCTVMLPDSGYIQEMEVERKNRKNMRSGLPLLDPIYTAEDARNCIKYFKGKNYNQLIELNENISIRFKDAGHILGSSIIEIYVKTSEGTKKITFSGDLGNPDTPLVNDPDILEGTDYLVVESTYGSRNHRDNNETARLEELSKIIEETFAAGGNLVIPAFAVERTQDLLFDLNQLMAAGKIQRGNIFVDSPLAIAITKIFCKNSENFDEKTKNFSKETGRCPIMIDGLKFTKTPEESMAINKIKKGAIIISASGMAEAGRIKHHLRHNLWRPNSTVLFIGFQAEGTLGRRILDGASMVRIHGEEIKVRARIANIASYSSHADQEGILEWVDNIKKKPELIFIVHGESEQSTTLQSLVAERYGIETLVPDYLEQYDLIKQLPAEQLPDKLDITGVKLQEQLDDLVRNLSLLGRNLISHQQYEEATKLIEKAREIEKGLV